MNMRPSNPNDPAYWFNYGYGPEHRWNFPGPSPSAAPKAKEVVASKTPKEVEKEFNLRDWLLGQGKEQEPSEGVDAGTFEGSFGDYLRTVGPNLATMLMTGGVGMVPGMAATHMVGGNQLLSARGPGLYGYGLGKVAQGFYDAATGRMAGAGPMTGFRSGATDSALGMAGKNLGRDYFGREGRSDRYESGQRSGFEASPADRGGTGRVAGPLREGGLVGYARGGMAGDGQSDSIPAVVDGKMPAALSTGEYVVPADVVAMLGAGDNEAGARRLDSMLKEVRMKAMGHKKQMKPVKTLSSMRRGPR